MSTLPEQILLFLVLLILIVPTAVMIRRTSVPLPLALVLVGFLIGYIPGIPKPEIDPNFILFVLLPPLIFKASTGGSWRDVRKNTRPILLLSVGHVLFITGLVAWVGYQYLNLSWPLAFMLGAVISPPDDVAFASVAQKIGVPKRISIVLSAEGLFNDATALTVLRMAIIAAVSHQFSISQSIYTFLLIALGETIYGYCLAFVVGHFRKNIKDTDLEMLLSLLTPFLAFIPCALLGGSGVLATAVTGFYTGHVAPRKFESKTLLHVRTVWKAIGFVLENFLFLWAGLSAGYLVHDLPLYPNNYLLFAGFLISMTVIVGRFLWVYPAVYLPRLISRKIRAEDPIPPWQAPFLISWAGMRGAISIAAVLTIPAVGGFLDPSKRDFVIFLTFCVVFATLVVQGLTLPWLVKISGVEKYVKAETDDYNREIIETKLKIKNAALSRIDQSIKKAPKDDPHLASLRMEYECIVGDHLKVLTQNESPQQDDGYWNLFAEERQILLDLYDRGEISAETFNALEEELNIRESWFKRTKT